MILQWTLDVSDKPSCSRFALLIPSKILPCILQSPFYLLNTFFLCCSFSSSCIIFLSFAPSSSLYTSLFALIIRKILALCVCPSSSSLPRHYSPFALSLSLFLSVLPHPAASAVRDTPSRMSEGDEMRRLIGFHGNQPALHWHLSVEPPSSSIAPRCTSLVLRTDAVRHAGNIDEKPKRLFWISWTSPEGERRRLFSNILRQLFRSRRWEERLRQWPGIG